MAIDPFAETVVSFSQAGKHLPKVRGKKVAICTIWRWANAGLKAADGTTAVLETVKIGGTTCTSLEALRRFFDLLTPQRATIPGHGHGVSSVDTSAAGPQAEYGVPFSLARRKAIRQ